MIDEITDFFRNLDFNFGDRRYDVKALNDFVHGNWTNGLSDNQAKKNLEEGLVEIIHDGSHSSNGLLITANGYFITSNHCVEKNLGSLKLRNW